MFLEKFFRNAYWSLKSGTRKEGKKANRKCFILLCVLLSLHWASADANYEETKLAIQNAQKDRQKQFSHLSSDNEKQELLKQSAIYFHQSIVEQLAPSWIGTAWAFHGTTQTPQKGSIACGYFVTTLLRDAGVNLQRNKLAQQTSENIIKSLVTSESIKRFSNIKLSSFIKALQQWGEGLYIVGLDNHVGFISVEAEGVFFIHSSYESPFSVTREFASQSTILERSKYRVLGKLDDQSFIEAWISNRYFSTKGSH